MKIDDAIPTTNQAISTGPRFRQMTVAPALTRFILGAVLLLAAGLKAHASPTLFSDFQSAVIIIEAVLGVWLVIGWRWSVSRIIASAWMLALSAVSFHKALAGDSSCGCFGQLHINPWLIFCFDATALAALIATPGIVSKALSAPRRTTIAGFQLAMLSILIAGLVNSLRASSAPAPAVIQAQSANWRQAGTWPLSKYIDVWDDISHGKWVVLVYNSRCRPCTSTRDEYELLAKQWRSQNNPLQIAMLDIAGKDADPAEGTDPNSAGLYGQLNLPENSNIDIASPSLVLLNDGKVVQLSEGYEDSQWNDRVFPE